MGWFDFGSEDTSSSSTYNSSQNAARSGAALGQTTPMINPAYAGIFNTAASNLGLTNAYNTFAFNPPAPSSGVAPLQMPTLPNTSASGMGSQAISYLPSGYTPGTAPLLDSAAGTSSGASGSSSSSTQPIYYQNGGLPSSTYRSGSDPLQAYASDWQQSQLMNGGFYGNTLAQQIRDRSDIDAGTAAGINTQFVMPLIASLQNAPQAQGTQSAGTSQVHAATTASGLAPYSGLFGSQVTNPALAAYDYGTDRAFSALDARTAGAGAFGNSRSGLAYSDLGAQSALGRGQLSSSLNQQGLTNALGFAQGDVTRGLQADTTNAANTLTNNLSNAQLAQQNSQFNVNARQQNTAQQLQGMQQLSNNLVIKTGIDQQVINNLITAQGIDTQAAQNLFQAGTISQQQLMQLLQAAAQVNGQQTAGIQQSNAFQTANGSQSGTSSTDKFSFSPSISDLLDLGSF